MKKVILSVFMVLGMMGIANATPVTVSTPAPAAVSDAACKYKLADARAGLKDFVVLGFIPRQQSEDGNRVLGTMVYHNPKNKSATSQDAFALVLLDKQAGAELTVFEREINGKKLGPCFNKKVEENEKPQ
jgi:hypothetical protein